MADSGGDVTVAIDASAPSNGGGGGDAGACTVSVADYCKARP